MWREAFSRPVDMIVGDIFNHGNIKYCKEYIGWWYPRSIALSEKGFTRIFFDLYDEENIKKGILKLIESDPKWISEVLIRNYFEMCNNLNIFGNKILLSNMDNVNEHLLTEYFTTYVDLFEKITPYLQVPRRLSEPLSEFLVDAIRKEGLNLTKNEIAKPCETSSLLVEQELIYNIFLELCKTKEDAVDYLLHKDFRRFRESIEGTNLEKIIGGYEQNYAWLKEYFEISDLADSNFHLERLARIAKKGKDAVYSNLIETKKKINNTREEYTRLLEKIQSDEIRDLTSSLGFYIYMKDHSTIVRCSFKHNTRNLMVALMSRMGLNRKDFKYTLPDDIFRYLHEGEVVKSSVRLEREIGHAYLLDHTKLEYYTGGNFNKISSLIRDSDNQSGISEENLKGVGSSSGVIPTAKARIVLCPEDLKKLQDGDVLVCKRTTMDYVEAIHNTKISAIVTDEGGYTSHASIICREIGVPCVTRTKIATSIIKDGDELFVDGNNGIVKIVKKNDN